MARKGLKVIEMDLRGRESTTDFTAIEGQVRGRLFDKLTPAQKSQLARMSNIQDMAQLRQAAVWGRVSPASVMDKSKVKLKVFKPNSLRTRRR